MQVRILTLVLIGVLLSGQALYDFFKKRRATPPHNIPSVNKRQHQRHSPVNHNSERRSYLTTPTERQPVQYDFTTVDEVIPEPMLAKETIENLDNISPIQAEAQTSHQPDSTSKYKPSSHDELRRAVIWGEILKRKF